MKNYTIDCKNYNKSFDTVNELVDDVIISGICPFHDIVKNGRITGEKIQDLIHW